MRKKDKRNAGNNVYLLFSVVFDVLVFVSLAVHPLLGVVHPILCCRSRTAVSGLFLFVAGPSPTSSHHDCGSSIQYLQGSEIRHC